MKTMDRVRRSTPQLASVVPYDPKYLYAETMLSANENPLDINDDLRRKINTALHRVHMNRYPDPLANDLRDMIAKANGLDRCQVVIGNGGDELLFNVALAWGGPGRVFLNLPPTFSVYETNARLVGCEVLDIPRKKDFSIDEQAVLACVAKGGCDYTIITSPNNPTGQLASERFIENLLTATDALVVVDEAYFEFSRRTVRPLLDKHKNLAILRTFSKAFSLAGVRVGYLMGSEEVIREFIKVRQPYSVDAVSQAIAQVVYENRSQFEHGIQMIVQERMRVYAALHTMPGVKPFETDANYILFRAEAAEDLWRSLLDKGVLIRDFSATAYLQDCLRVTIGTTEENDRFLSALREVLSERSAKTLGVQ